jgi:hypothetical protein
MLLIYLKEENFKRLCVRSIVNCMLCVLFFTLSCHLFTHFQHHILRHPQYLIFMSINQISRVVFTIVVLRVLIFFYYGRESEL